jgi:hypothetical protein
VNTKNYKTLQEIFNDPVKANINWSDIEKLFMALGAGVSEGRGSRVRISLKGVRAVFHRPHPQKETDKNTVRDVREVLRKAGIR